VRKIFLLIARALFSLIFIVAGANKLLNWSDAIVGLDKALRQWQIYFESNVYINDSIHYIVSKAPLLMGIAMFLEIVGALLILTNYKMRFGAFLLLIFLIPTTMIFHPFWLEIGESFHIQMALFLKNISIMGALLYLLVGPQSKK
jgi:putative oxidoreductase